MYKHSGYTLSETLITLIIIGVIATITIPTMIGNAGRKNLDAGVAKAYYTLNEALDLVKSDTASVPKCYYGYDYENVQKNSALNDTSDCENFYKKFVRKINTVKVCEGSASGCTYDGFKSAGGGCEFGSGAGAFVTTDGMLFILYQSTSPTFLVDVNGAKGPNKWGYDMFTFSIYGDGKASGVESGECMAVAAGGKTAAQILQGSN